MMESVTHLLWKAANRPPGEGNTEGICRVCGVPGTGLSFNDWVRPTFTDWDKLQPSDILCQPCQFAFEERSELLAARVGKDKPQRMRNYSHFVVNGEWTPLSKSNKAEMARILLEESPEVAIVAVSGQKHIIFRAQPGWWQVEEQAQLADPPTLQWHLERVEILYNGDFAKSEIETGDYAQHRILRFGVGKWQAYEESLRPFRQSALFQLAVFLVQKKGEQNGGTGRVTPASSGIAGRDMARDTGQLQEPLSAQHLATVRGQREEHGVHQQSGQVRQLSLPKFGG